MGRYWCRTDPKGKYLGKSFHLLLSLPLVARELVTGTEFKIRVPQPEELDFSPGQEALKVFGQPYTVKVEQGEPRIQVKVTLGINQTHALMAECHDASGVFGDLMGLGWTGTWLELGGIEAS